MKEKIKEKKQTPSDHSDMTPEMPRMVIIEQSEEINHKEADELTIAIIESCITDKDKARDFDCIFTAQTKSKAIIFRDCLRYNHEYKTDKPILDEGEWSIHANKFISFTNLREELDKAKKLAKIHSAELVDWIFEVDKQPDSNPSETETGTKK